MSSRPLELDPLMHATEDLAALEKRISHAVSDCESWRRTGLTEKYIEAYDLVEALQLLLRRRLRLPGVNR